MRRLNTNKFKLSPIASILAVALGMSSSLVFAQEDQAENDESDTKVITITASKRETSLQATPIAVTVVSSETIEQAKILDMADLQTNVPTLRVSGLQRSTNASFSIRGFGNGANNDGIEPSVGIFIDGVYRSRAASQIGDLPRLQQIEVLSGPQSTLFGKNASAGVISVRTEEPSDTFQGKIEAGIGNFNQRLFKAYVTGGLTENLSYSLSAGINTRDGFTDSVVPDIKQLNNRDRWNIRAQALYEPSEDVSVRLIIDQSEIDEICCTVADVINGPTTGAVQFLGGVVLDTVDPFAYESALNMSPQNNVEDGGVSMQVDVDFDGFSFTSITAQRSNDSSSEADVDYTSLDILRLGTGLEIDTFTQEFRLTSTGTNKFDWMVGAFIFDEDVESRDDLTFGTGIRPFFDVLLGDFPGILGTIENVLTDVQPGDFFGANQRINTEFTQADEAFSLFANFDYRFTDDLTGTFGLSYTKDEKKVTVRQPINEDILSSFEFETAPTVFGVPFGLIPDFAPLIPTLQSFQFVPPNLDLPNSAEDNESSDSELTWSTRLAYEINDDLNVFATAATGFKASSWNLSRDTRPFPSDQAGIVNAGIAQPNQTYGTRFAAPEKSTVYELGIKTTFDKGSFNATYFDQTIEDFQSSVFVGTGFVLANAGQQSATGVEFNAVYNPTEEWTLSLGGVFLDPVFDSFEGAQGVNGAEDLSGKKPAGIHETSITAGVAYNYETDNGTYGFIRTDYIYESKVHLVENVPESLTRQVNMLNASAGLQFTNDIQLQLWVRNLNDAEFFISSFPPPIQGGSFNAYPNQPKTYGLTVSYEF
ncbi:MAG: TonB-dependent receptor [Kangiellaceae bacterium]|nr:TonB-dependent receptor [Kangiellaceae bacterium]